MGAVRVVGHKLGPPDHQRRLSGGGHRGHCGHCRQGGSLEDHLLEEGCASSSVVHRLLSIQGCVLQGALQMLVRRMRRMPKCPTWAKKQSPPPAHRPHTLHWKCIGNRPAGQLVWCDTTGHRSTSCGWCVKCGKLRCPARNFFVKWWRVKCDLTFRGCQVTLTAVSSSET